MFNAHQRNQVSVKLFLIAVLCNMTPVIACVWCPPDKLFHQAYVNFRRYCMESDRLPVDLHVVLSDILQEAGEYWVHNV